MEYEQTPHNKTKAGNPQKENKMKANKTTTPAAPKQPRTVKVKTLVIAAVIVATHAAAFIGGVLATNAYGHMIDQHAEARAAQLLQSDSKHTK